MKIVYMGTPEFAVAPLKALIDAGYEIAAVVTVPDKPKGRGLQLAQSDVKKFVVENYPQIPLLQPVKLRDPQFVDELQGISADLFVVVAFRMLPECVWQMPPLGTFNLHASLLPKFRGAAPINWAIITGESKTGVTTFLIDKEIDTGKIMMRREMPISSVESAGTLHDKLMEIGSELVVESVKGLEEGTIQPYAQPELPKELSYLSKAPKLNPNNTRIDWNCSAREIYNLVRGLSPYPAAICIAEENEGTDSEPQKRSSIQFKVFETKIPSAQISLGDNSVNAEEVAPGTIIATKKRELFVKCADGFIQITNLQMSGKKRMTTFDFLLGFRDMNKYHFV